MTGKTIRTIRITILVLWLLLDLLLLVLIFQNGYTRMLRRIFMGFLWSNFGVILLESILKHIENKKSE